MTTILLASNNKNKIREIKEIYKGINIVSLKEMGIDVDIPENGNTFKENAIEKALYCAKNYNIITLADDSGLCCLGLDLKPGVHSARYASNHDDHANNMKLISEMANIKNKKAYYACAIALALPNGKVYVKERKVWGLIQMEAKGNNGFGYDPYFYIPKLKKTMAELELDEKNKISHRMKALKAIKGKVRKVS